MEHIKLNHISAETMLTVESCPMGYFGVMTKEIFLNSSFWLDIDHDDKESIPIVTVAEKSIANLSFEQIIQREAEEMYEDWQDDVICALEKELDLKGIEEKFNKIFDKYPTWCEGKTVNLER